MQANLHVSCGAMFVAQRHERTSSYLGSGQKFSRATQFWCHLFEARPHRSAPPGTFSNVEEPNRAVAVDQNGPGMNSAPTVESLDHDHAYDTYDHRPRRSRSSRRSRSRRTRFTRRSTRRSQSMRSHRSRRYRRSPQRLYSPARSRAQGVWANQDLLEAPPGELAVSTTATTSVSTTTIGAGEKIPTFYSFSSTSVTGIIRCADG